MVTARCFVFQTQIECVRGKYRTLNLPQSRGLYCFGGHNNQMQNTGALKVVLRRYDQTRCCKTCMDPSQHKIMAVIAFGFDMSG